MEFNDFPCIHIYIYNYIYIVLYSIGNNNSNWRTHIVQRGGSTTNQDTVDVFKYYVPPKLSSTSLWWVEITTKTKFRGLSSFSHQHCQPLWVNFPFLHYPANYRWLHSPSIFNKFSVFLNLKHFGEFYQVLYPTTIFSTRPKSPISRC